jgi:superfamily II DNA/RNA helicase
MSIVEKIPEVWQEKWNELGFSAPSVIQEKSFDFIKNGESLLAISPTGSGKTLAYTLPSLLTVKKGEGNQLLILVSSAELASQVDKVVKEWAGLLELSTELILANVNVKRQI